MLNRLAKLWLGWFLVYMVTGAYAMTQKQTSFFAATVDHVDSLWIKLLFLNIPLQIVLALSAILLHKSPKIGLRNVCTVIAVVNTVLIALHIMISIGVHFTR